MQEAVKADHKDPWNRTLDYHGVFLGDLTPKGKKYGSKQVSPIGGGMSSNGGEIWGEEKGANHGFRGRPSRHWMMLSIQASVSSSNCQFLQIYACFDCVVINHQKREIVTNMAPFMSFQVILVIV